MPDLTPAEAAFFETGELPPELSNIDPPAPPPAPPVPPPAPSPNGAAPPIADPAEAVRRSLADEQARRIQAETRAQELERQLQAKSTPPAPESPDPTTDPLGAMMHQLAQVNGTVTELQKQLTQEQQKNLLKQQFDQFTTSVRQIKEDFERSTPDFADAYNHIRTVRTEDLRTLGVPEAQIPQALLQDEIQLAQAAISRGKNPAEEMYAMSKRYGYQPKTAAPPAAKPPTPEEKLAALQKGADASRQPPRAAPASDLTVEGLKDAGDADLNKMVQDDSLWAKLVGGTTNDIF